MPQSSELQRMVKARMLPAKPLSITATSEERADLARRFSLASVESLEASIALEPVKTGVRAAGSLNAQITQICAVSGEKFPVTIEEPIDLRFIEEGSAQLTPSEEAEIDFDLTADDCDEIEYSGDAFDLGEAVAQTLGLAIDPYAEGPNAEKVRREAGLGEAENADGPLAAALSALKKNG